MFLGIDMNEDVQMGRLAKRLIVLGFHDAVLSTYPLSSPPATFSQNQSRTPVETIWSSKSVVTTRAGYFAFGTGAPSAMSDGHRLIWIEVKDHSMLGKHLPSNI